MTPEGDTAGVNIRTEVTPHRLCSDRTKVDDISSGDLHDAEWDFGHYLRLQAIRDGAERCHLCRMFLNAFQGTKDIDWEQKSLYRFSNAVLYCDVRCMSQKSYGLHSTPSARSEIWQCDTKKICDLAKIDRL